MGEVTAAFFCLLPFGFGLCYYQTYTSHLSSLLLLPSLQINNIQGIISLADSCQSVFWILLVSEQFSPPPTFNSVSILNMYQDGHVSAYLQTAHHPYDNEATSILDSDMSPSVPLKSPKRSNSTRNKLQKRNSITSQRSLRSYNGSPVRSGESGHEQNLTPVPGSWGGFRVLEEKSPSQNYRRCSSVVWDTGDIPNVSDVAITQDVLDESDVPITQANFFTTINTWKLPLPYRSKSLKSQDSDSAYYSASADGGNSSPSLTNSQFDDESSYRDEPKSIHGSESDEINSPLPTWQLSVDLPSSQIAWPTYELPASIPIPIPTNSPSIYGRETPSPEYDTLTQSSRRASAEDLALQYRNILQSRSAMRTPNPPPQAPATHHQYITRRPIVPTKNTRRSSITSTTPRPTNLLSPQTARTPNNSTHSRPPLSYKRNSGSSFESIPPKQEYPQNGRRLRRKDSLPCLRQTTESTATTSPLSSLRRLPANKSSAHLPLGGSTRRRSGENSGLERALVERDGGAGGATAASSARIRRLLRDLQQELGKGRMVCQEDRCAIRALNEDVGKWLGRSARA